MTRTSCLFFLTCLIQDVSAQLKSEFPELLTLQSFRLRGDIMRVGETGLLYRADGQKTAVRNLVFDEKGRIDTLNVTDTNQIHTLKVFRYGGDIQIKSRVVRTGKKGGDSSVFSYGKSGRLREIQRFSPDGDRIGRMRYRYDGGGRLIYIMSNDGNNKLLEMMRFKYPARDEYLRTVFNEDQQYVSAIHFMRTEDTAKSQWTRFYYSAPDSCTGIENISYNAAGLETARIVMTAERKMTAHSTCSYNAAGDPEEKAAFSEAAEGEILVRHEYLYDPSGNWIRRITYLNDTLEKVTIREISYRDMTE